MSGRTVPNSIVHYNRSEPFRSLTSLPDGQLKNVVAKLTETESWGLARFADNEYLERRKIAENTIRQAFIHKGGTPNLQNPIYCFLGRNEGFESHKLNQGYLILLKDLPANSVSFTLGDSLLAFDDYYRSLSGDKYRNPLCSQVFLFDEVVDLLENGEEPHKEQLHIEAQLWITPPQEVVKKLASHEVFR